jgi:P-type Mg2+ transporter
LTAPAYWNWDTDRALRELGAQPTGLSGPEAARRLAASGKNTLQQREQETAARLLLRQFESPLVLILVLASLIALSLGEWTEGAIILAIILGSTVLGFAQEYHASRAVVALRSRLALKTRVLRAGEMLEVPATDIVVGDVVILSAGNLVPADALVLAARDFLVLEASFTGEPYPVEKSPGVVAADAPLASRCNSVFAGTSVRSGEARVLVTRTGRGTEFGAVAERLRSRPPETPFGRGLRRFGFLLLRVMVLLVLFVLVMNQLLGRPFFDSLLFSIALAVGMSPELLPAIVSVTLSSGARRMAARGVLVRRLQAIENLGQIDVLCTDKTGTLTEGSVALQQAVDAAGEPSTRVFELAFANASLETGIENPLDQAIVAAGKARGLDASGWRKRDEIPYDFQRRRLSILVEQSGDGLLVTKGAVDQMLEVCSRVRTPEGIAPLDTTRLAQLQSRCAALGESGLRVLAVATRELPGQQRCARSDEHDLTLEGMITFLDPLRPDARETIAALRTSGITVKIITGDNRFVGAHIAAQLGLDPRAIIRGAEISRAGTALLQLAERGSLFVEVDPQQKEQLVQALQRGGHAVGYMGDGVNDAPALHAADVGISVDTAVDVAREAADVILLRSDLSVLRLAVQDGRRAFANTIKYVSITTGSSFGNMVSMALATPLLPFLPLTATQVLLTNFLTDLPLMAITSDSVDPEHVAAPQRWSVQDVQRFMMVFGLISSLFDLASFAMLRWLFAADATAFQTSWFMISVLTELTAVLVLRTRRVAWSSRPGSWIIGLSVVVALATLVAPWLPWVSGSLGFVPPRGGLLAGIFVIVLVYAAATEAAKARFYRRGAS